MLAGLLPDQAALQGILINIGNLNLTLISVTQVEEEMEGGTIWSNLERKLTLMARKAKLELITQIARENSTIERRFSQ